MLYMHPIYISWSILCFIFNMSLFTVVFCDMITILSNNELRHCHMDTTDTAIDLKNTYIKIIYLIMKSV